ncbi:O-antigen ligase domain-containing protein [Flammeovirga sp. MY04]|uniref:O-antigen ligase family protein n=1 Tax=Flammeovirga sp. MY04 TaxID=1191459 RepID=UPI0008061A86|nr:O-antigen ligase family protein [Flammeovirga sp. MY04]ANQ52088.1 O-antigen ligase domain-containing protein [Flammeovirga sp. MY04]
MSKGTLIGIFSVIIALLISLGISHLANNVNWGLGVAIAVMSIAIPFLLSLFFYARMSIYFYIFLSIFIGIPLKMNIPAPIGLGFDFAIMFTILGHLYKCGEMKDYASTFKVPMMYPIAGWICWNIIQVANPSAASRVAWFFVMRPYVLYPLLYFIVYYYFKTIDDLKSLIFFMFGCCYFSGLWGVIQNINGYFPFEMAWVFANDAKHLVYISGRWRVFGTLASPAHFGMLMAIIIVMGVFLLPLYNMRKKIFIIIGTIICLPALVWSGTRSGIALVVVIVAIVVALWGNTKVYMAGAVFAVFFIILINTPTDNYHIQRIQSTFAGSKDTSYKEREENRHAMYPWIFAHPLGGGLGSTGVWGVRFSPGTMLANFAPDSGHLRVMVEAGWLGLIVYSTIFISFIYYFLTQTQFWRLDNTELKVLLLSLYATLASIIVVEQAQDVNGILPFNILMWIWIAMLMRTIEHIQKYFKDKNERLQNEENERLRIIDEKRKIKLARYNEKFNANS